MTKIENKKIGLISDSHSMNSLMLDAIHTLNEMGAGRIIHLGDICDSRKYQSLDEAVDIIEKYNIKAILGNNECYIMTELNYNSIYDLKDSTIAFIQNLPYSIQVDDLCFTHSLPFAWPAATRYPIEDYITFFAGEGNTSFRIMFRGHSHRTTIVEMKNGMYNSIPVEAGQRIQLHNDKRYIITIGAVEDGICTLYDPASNEFITVSI